MSADQPGNQQPQDAVEAEVAKAESQQWERLSPRMLLIHPIREVGRFLPAIIGVFIASNAGRDDGMPPWLTAITVAVPILLGLLRWYLTRYRITPDQIQLRKGLFQRTTHTAPVDRVRSIDVTATPLHRVLGLAVIAIGTGADESSFKLEGMDAAAAPRLRDDLLHRRAIVRRDEGEAPLPVDSDSGHSEPDQTLLRLNPAWIRYAPFGPSGLIAAGAIFALGGQLTRDLNVIPGQKWIESTSENLYTRFGAVLLIALGVLAAILLVVLLSLVAYALSYWGFTVTRNLRGRTLHVRRGLLTTRSTTLEEKRIRGVVLNEPLSFRMVGAGRLSALATGLGHEGNDSVQSDLLVPPAPAGVARQVGQEVLQASDLFATPLLGHGPAAVRRRWTRALTGGIVVAALWVGGVLLWFPSAGYAALGLLPILLACGLAADRARGLGSALTERFLLVRSGSLFRHTDALQRTGTVAVTLRRSFFQRRAGLTTLVVASAAGHEAYGVIDLPAQRAEGLAGQLLPNEVLAPFVRG